MNVSLILTVLNEGAALRPLLESIIEQTRPPDEVVVVDGGSTDDTLAILESYSDRLPLRVIAAPGVGISEGRNIAVRHARYQVIAVTDGGVRLDPAWLEHLIAPFSQNPRPDLVSGFFLPDPRSRFEYALAATTLPAAEEMGRGRFLPSSRSVAFTRAIWSAVGGYPEWMSYSEDVLFDLALLRGGARIAHAPEAIVYFRPRPSLAAFARQYRNYAYGDGQALLWPRRHASRYATYLVALPLAVALLARRPALGLAALSAGAAAMFFTPLKRLMRQHRPWRHKIAAAPLVPLIRIVGDLAKMVGFPRGLPEGWATRDRTRAYLSQNLTISRQNINRSDNRAIVDRFNLAYNTSMSETMSRAEIQRYLNLAREDLQAASDNLQLGHLRVVISRAYYAMFYASTALLGSRGLWRSKHQGVIAAFGEHFVKPGLIEPEYGRVLNDAFHARLDSDYGPQPDLDAEGTGRLVEKAQAFVERVARLVTEIDDDGAQSAAQ